MREDGRKKTEERRQMAVEGRQKKEERENESSEGLINHDNCEEE